MKRTKTWCYRSGLIGALCIPSMVFAFTPPTYDVDGSTPATQTLGAVQLLGQGFDMDRDVGRETCLSGTTTSAGIATAALEVQQVMSRDNFSSELNVSLSGSYGSGPFKADAKASFFNSTVSNNYSTSFMYAGKVGLTNEIFQLNQTAPISPLGQSALNIGLNQFRDTCGNRFVQQYITGAGLYFIVKFEFASTEQKTKFDSSVSGSYGAASLSAAASKAVSDNHITGSVSVRAMQIGGDAKQLLGIVGSDGSGQAPVKVCSLSDITACSNLLTSLLKYTASVPAQIQQVGAQNQILGYVLQDYGVALIPQPLPSILTLELVTARNDLLNMLESQSADLDRANALMLAFGASMNAADYAALDRLIIDLTFNIPKIQAAGLACWELPSDCITKKTELGWLLRPLNRASLTMQLIIPAGYFSKGDAYAYYASGNGTYCTVVDTLEDKQGSSAALQAILPHLYTTIYPHGVKYRGLLPIEKEVLRTMSFLGNCARPTNEIYANTGGHPYECTTTWFTPSGTFAARFIANIYKGSLNCNSPAYTKYCAADSAHDVTNVLHCM